MRVRRRMIGGEMAEAEAAAKEGQKATEIEAEEAALNAKRNAFVKLYQKFKGPDTDAYKPSKAKATMKKNAKALMRTPDGLSEFSDEELRDMSKPFSDKQEREAQETLMKLWRKAAASAIKKGSPREAQRLIATGHFNGMAPYLSTVSDKKLAAAGLERKISIIGGGED
ncbi:hypothetical protein FRB96_005932 [Tulasnella sp. 330]|nr:hypothetical protein FRB96_005932 [Tulasnella sp. 330]KAG8871147.1 hypothetical protein FRB97_008964 [Tulasnella sp. 331]KAG8873729.1 hypothetical protein FRB98_008814 [Tulasnella sp. 332]